MLANRLAAAAEQHGLLPERQFGSWRGRSTEAAIKFVVQGVRTAWKAGGSASLLQLDLIGAFDRVPHGALVGTLRGAALPEWYLQWLTAGCSCVRLV